MTATTIILLVCAVVITVAFILLAAYLLPVLLRLRDMMGEIQSTAAEAASGHFPAEDKRTRQQ